MHGGQNVLSSLLALRGVTRLQSAAIGEARAGVVVPRDTLACCRIKPCARVLVACIQVPIELFTLYMHLSRSSCLLNSISSMQFLLKNVFDVVFVKTHI